MSPRPATVAEQSGMQPTMSSPLNGATIAMFLSGLGISAAALQIASFLVQDLGASSGGGPVLLDEPHRAIAGYLVGTRSDRTGKQLGPFRLCALADFLGWIAIAFSTAAWEPFVISALVLGFAGAAGSQLFAVVHDDLTHDGADGEGVVAIVRMALTAGWVGGPVLGSYHAAATGFRAMLVTTGICTLAQILPLGTLRSRTTTTVWPTVEPPKPKRHTGLEVTGCASCCPCSRSPGSTYSCTPESRPSTRT
jgi:SET family sugar efflux transporter-like MFS transporter